MPSEGTPDFGGARFARDTWYGLLAQGVDKLLPVALVLYLARTLSPEGFGTYSFLLAYLAFFQVAVEYSVDTVLVRSISQQPSRGAAFLRAGLGLKLVLGLSAVVVAVGFAGPASGGKADPAIVLLASLGLVTALGGAFRAWFRARLRIGAVLAIAITRALLLAVGVVVAVQRGAGLHGIFGVVILANIVTFLAVAVYMRKQLVATPSYDSQIWRLLLRGALPLALNAFALTVSLRAGQVLLMSMRGPVEVGLLGAASRITEAFTLLPEALMISVYPLMAGLHENDSARLLNAARKSARYLVLATGIPVLICVVGAPQIMALLFGEGFRNAGAALAVLGFVALLGAAGTVITNLLVAVHQEKALYRNTMVFAAVNVVLTYLLIRVRGYEGAAIAMVVSSALSQLALMLLPATARWVRPCLVSVAPILIAVIAAAAMVSLVALETVPALILAVGVYLISLAASGAIGHDDLRFIASMVRPTSRAE